MQGFCAFVELCLPTDLLLGKSAWKISIIEVLRSLLIESIVASPRADECKTMLLRCRLDC